ncbi:MAG: helix-turn-helix domain-containing protein [Ignavibacteriaceae bacterium]
MGTPYLTIKEVAELLGRSTKWVYKNQLLVPGYFKLAGSIFFDREVLLSTLKTKATKPVKRLIR